jgi:hypothetical protein
MCLAVSRTYESIRELDEAQLVDFVCYSGFSLYLLRFYPQLRSQKGLKRGYITLVFALSE